MLERLFRLSAHGTTACREVLGGVTTFATMAYVIVVNPAILSFAGIPVGPGTVATILAAVFGALLMGLYANRPIAVAPYMGENALVAFGLAAIGATWPQTLGARAWWARRRAGLTSNRPPHPGGGPHGACGGDDGGALRRVFRARPAPLTRRAGYAVAGRWIPRDPTRPKSLGMTDGIDRSPSG